MTTSIPSNYDVSLSVFELLVLETYKISTLDGIYLNKYKWQMIGA